MIFQSKDLSKPFKAELKNLIFKIEFYFNHSNVNFLYFECSELFRILWLNSTEFKTNIRGLKKHLDYQINENLIKEYKYNEKNKTITFYKYKSIDCQENKKQTNKNIFYNYLPQSELNKILKPNLILKPFELKINQNPKLEKDVQVIIEQHLLSISDVKNITPFKTITWIWQIDTFVELNNWKYIIIEYKFSLDKRVLSQTLWYSFFVSKELNIPIHNIDTIIIQTNFKKTDFWVKTFF